MIITALHKDVMVKPLCTILTWCFYFVKNYIRYGEVPKDMVEDNIRIDYEKLRMLIRKIRSLPMMLHHTNLNKPSYITGEVKKGFPAASIIDPDNFISLLYYFGMLTINGTQ